VRTLNPKPFEHAILLGFIIFSNHG